MHPHASNLIPLIGLLMLLMTGARALAQSPGIRDEGKFFGPDAIKSAAAVIEQIETAHQKDLRIETFPEIPNDLLPRFDQEGKQRFFEHWTNDLAMNQHVNGVYILICRHPGHIEVWLGNNTGRHLFTADDRDFLLHKLVNRFHQHEYDDGLLDAVHFVQRQMDDRSKATEDPNAPLSLTSLPSGEASGMGDCPRAGWGEAELQTARLTTDHSPCHPERSEGTLTRETYPTARSFAGAQDDNAGNFDRGMSLAIPPHLTRSGAAAHSPRFSRRERG